MNRGAWAVGRDSVIGVGASAVGESGFLARGTYSGSKTVEPIAPYPIATAAKLLSELHHRKIVPKG
jgi:hypothetical protein